MPICRELIAIIVLDMLADGCLLEGLIVLWSLDGSNREQDWANLCGGDVAVARGAVAFAFGRRARGEASKTGSNQGMVACLAITGFIVAEMAKAVGSGGLIFPITTARFRLVWWRVLHRRGKKNAPPPTTSATRRRRSLCREEVRWRKAGDVGAGRPSIPCSATRKCTSWWRRGRSSRTRR